MRPPKVDSPSLIVTIIGETHYPLHCQTLFVDDIESGAGSIRRRVRPARFRSYGVIRAKEIHFSSLPPQRKDPRQGVAVGGRSESCRAHPPIPTGELCSHLLWSNALSTSAGGSTERSKGSLPLSALAVRRTLRR